MTLIASQGVLLKSNLLVIEDGPSLGMLALILFAFQSIVFAAFFGNLLLMCDVVG